MTAVDLDTARQLIGDGVPSTGALPAAWWTRMSLSTLAKAHGGKAERLKTGTEE
ncbi:hypothetical protein SEA_MUTANTE_55 [Mycobacterium phage Mutante]|uniref:Uncharacterized protein n=1 Tax=Mycobacterium phage Mutante TaxID=2250381 RepID=A0A2Z5HEF8_9CAUD|nr:hypothetical protein SEA_MUTANTE_55 [Mycobacterium phage Mutante]